MNYKPDEGTLMAYLYGELDASETAKVQVYLQQHPEELAKLESMQQVKNMLGQIQNKEVIAPPIFVEDDKVRSLWSNAYVKTILSIAASLLLIMVAGNLLGTEINYSGGELKISFNGKHPAPIVQQALLTENKVKEMIETSLVKNNEVIATNWNEEQKKLSENIAQNLNRNSKRIDALMKATSQASEDQVRGFVAGLQNENLKLMKDYFQLSSADQKKYMESLLVDFSGYLKEQRKQDMIMLQTRVNGIEKTTDQFKQETEQILASIISKPVKNKNSY